MTKTEKLEGFYSFCAVMIFLSWVCWMLAICFHSWMLFAVGCAVAAQVNVFLVLGHLETVSQRKAEQ